MKYALSTADLRQISISSHGQETPLPIREYSQHLSPAEGIQMHMKSCELPGITLIEWHGQSHGGVSFQVSGNIPTVSINFLLSGALKSDHYAYGKDFCIYRNQHNLLYTPHSYGEHTFVEGESKAFLITFGLDYFSGLFDYNEEQVALMLERIHRQESFLAYRDMLPTEARMHAIIQEIRTCPLKGSLKKMYLEAKVLELLSLLLEQSQRPVTESNSLRKTDRDKLRQVQAYLDEHYVNPGSLLDIARMFGLNDFKLKKGFRELYQTTVFGYAHERRMELARKLLHEGTMNVSQVAEVVGYENPNHFSAAFKKRYGFSPGQLLRQA